MDEREVDSGLTADGERYRKQLGRLKAEIRSLAVLLQNLAESTRKRTDSELTPALKWMLMGVADAYALSARRTSELIDSSVEREPPSDGLYRDMHERLLDMLSDLSAERALEGSKDGGV